MPSHHAAMASPRRSADATLDCANTRCVSLPLPPVPNNAVDACGCLCFCQSISRAAARLASRLRYYVRLALPFLGVSAFLTAFGAALAALDDAGAPRLAPFPGLS
eukprot:CAMPEP_0118940550 /NCGR_PEP_ID=MMETSP1169-20130426/31742_1 /TAXON_ID=36882 /ORGANISM="Pyramimonas obovata, Strain CCMP722" /LENGTH=104 /DNA_ID=CAMNT_0006885075 /DNA_START=98 /DNA_END=409 /DNA_ORIENTATION=-